MIIIITESLSRITYQYKTYCIWYIFRLAFRLLSDVSYSDECRTKTVLSVCEKNVSAFSCNRQDILLLLGS